MKEDLNQLAQRVHQANIKWWQDPATGKPIERNKGELLMLVITELAECCEGERKNLIDDKLPHRKMAEVEMADTYIRLLDYAAGFKHNLVYVISPISDKGETNKGRMLLGICTQVTLIMQNPNNLTFSLSLIRRYCEIFGYDLMSAFEEKMAYNAKREDHKHEARLQLGGKQW